MKKEVQAFLEMHKEVVKDHTNRNTNVKDCYQTLIEIAIATEDPAWSVLTTHDVRDFAHGLKSKRVHIRHNWDGIKDRLHDKLVRYNGNIKASAEDLYPNSKHAHQSLRSWIKKNFKSTDHFVVSYEQERKSINKIVPLSGMTKSQMTVYVKMLEMIAGGERVKQIKQMVTQEK